MMKTPLFFSAVMICIQNLAPSFLPIHIPNNFFLPSMFTAIPRYTALFIIVGVIPGFYMYTI